LTKEQIEGAFRSTARQHHPDTGGDREAFILAQEARQGLLQRIRDIF
jgi:curved DNA-binding protein CbpA